MTRTGKVKKPIKESKLIDIPIKIEKSDKLANETVNDEPEVSLVLDFVFKLFFYYYSQSLRSLLIKILKALVM